MTHHFVPLRQAAGATLAFAAVTGLVLTGCSTGSSGSTGGSNTTPGKATSSKSAGSSSSGTSGGSTSVVSANSVPFPISAGDTWKYNNSSNAIAGGTTINRIASVTPVSGGQQVTMASTITTAAGTVSHPVAYFIFHPDGSITYPFSQFNNTGSAAHVRLLSGTIKWPPAAQIDSGQPSHDTLKIAFIISGVRKVLTAHITVQGKGTQSVTVPAGTYSATVVDMTMSETIEGIAVSSEIKSWLAAGVGPVQTEVIIHEGGHATVAAEEQLTSFTKG